MGTPGHGGKITAAAREGESASGCQRTEKALLVKAVAKVGLPVQFFDSLRLFQIVSYRDISNRP